MQKGVAIRATPGQCLIRIYGFTTVFPAMVMAPVLASALPSSVAPVFKVMDCSAITVPLKTEVVPDVAELRLTENVRCKRTTAEKDFAAGAFVT